MCDVYEFQNQNEKLLAIKQSQIDCIFAKKQKKVLCPVNIQHNIQHKQTKIQKAKMWKLARYFSKIIRSAITFTVMCNTYGFKMLY